MYYKVSVDQTGKTLHSKESFSTFHSEVHDFSTKEDALNWIKENYPMKPHAKIYVDKKDGTTETAGKIYRFRNQDISHMTKPFLEEDWVQLTSVKEEVLPF